MPPAATLSALSPPHVARNGLALTAVCLVALMFGLEISSVPVILPTLERELGTGFQDAQWIMNAYTLACTSVLMAAGTLADRFGRRRMLVLCLWVFGLASLACGLANDAPTLIVARFVQGIGAGAMMICQFAILSHLFREPAARARAFAIWGVIAGVGLGFGPMVGALILAVADWRWVFLAHVPLTLFTLVLLRISVQESRDPASHRLDIAGMLTLTLAVFALVYFITQGTEHGFTTPGMLGWAGLALVALLLFIVVEKRSAHPMFDISVLRIQRFTGALMGSIGMNFSFWPFMIYLPLYFQAGLGYDTLTTGGALLAYTLPTLLVPPLAERLALRYGAERIIPVGLATMGAGFLAMAAANGVAQPSTLLVLLSCVIAGIGLALTNSPTTNTTTGAVSADRAGMASGIDFSARLITLALNIALMGLVLLLGIGHYLAEVMPPSTAMEWPTLSQHIAAGKLAVPGLVFNEAQAALRNGAGWAMLFAGLGACGLAMLSGYFFKRRR
ncbi:Efflux pump transporter of major facilitator superfamily (MFS) [Pseudomonas sp. R4-39-08]|uniref:MFS transporter n=1 Tax=Pseudomonas sp. R4-39-08 TaxID=1173288 RepID=UPI000F559C0E|nr:MFS transporter [Pseudomonas sp. R4-39-08]AZF35800.1 Efflux pump transporter of major facilitator superfamily (MFS) [Pseudomonas sp. R4-39-08]